MLGAVALGGLVALTGCGTSSAADRHRLPPTTGTFDYQLGAAYDVPGGLDVVVRDATAEPAPGAYSLCYVNGFQTQPGEADVWLGEREDLLLHDAAGDLVVDPDWPDEHVLDPSTAAQREGILEVLGPVVTGCADAGFDAVEVDNLDTWTRFDDAETGRIDEDGALALAAAYVDLAHGAGLAVAQKNAAEIAALAHDELGFDLAVTEECAAFDECAAYTDVYGDHVLQVEYTDALPDPFADVCARLDRAPLTVLRDRDLVGPDDAGHVREQC
ncbi:endo alpha-1,4 polygalactosaminidase [Cellulosimicrobium terreum]|nr:endo alpha-1,4 polygalactosaminidase [Cellulosimicrobium terreum]